MASEVDKLVSYTQGATIDEDAVAAVVGVRHGESFSDFLDRIAARDAPGALAMIEHVLLLPKSGLVPIIIALTVQTLAIGWARQARDRGMAEHRLGSELFGLLKETGAYPMRSWSEATECWKKNVSRWDAAKDELCAANPALPECEFRAAIGASIAARYGCWVTGSIGSNVSPSAARDAGAQRNSRRSGAQDLPPVRAQEVLMRVLRTSVVVSIIVCAAACSTPAPSGRTPIAPAAAEPPVAITTHRALRDLTRDLELHFAVDARQLPQMRRKHDSDHGSVWTSTDSTGGRSRTIGAQLSPASVEAYT